jgi:hypothetical protein
MMVKVSKRTAGGEVEMGPRRIFMGLVFLALGVLGLFAVGGAVDWDRTVERWWPIAIVGWGVAEVIADRRVTLFDAFLIAIGLTLLADEQAWTVDGVLWSALFLFTGGAILLAGRADAPSRKRAGSDPGSGRPDARADLGAATAHRRRLQCP